MTKKPTNNTELEVTEKDVVTQASEKLSKQPRTIRDLIQGPEFKNALFQLLPSALRAERFVRVALNAMMKNPELADCSKASFFKCMLELSAMGLEPDGRHAHLIPYRNRKMCQCGHELEVHRGNICQRCGCTMRRTLTECQLIVDYKGIALLARRSGDVRLIHCDVVYENDLFDYSYGTGQALKHKPHPVDRGINRVAFYSYVQLKDGSEDFMVMNAAEVERIRKRSKTADAGPWQTDPDEMGKKTVFRRHSKWLPLSPEVHEAVEHGDTEAVDTQAVWTEELASDEQPVAAPKPKRLSARERILSQPSYAEDAEEQPVEPTQEEAPQEAPAAE